MNGTITPEQARAELERRKKLKQSFLQSEPIPEVPQTTPEEQEKQWLSRLGYPIRTKPPIRYAPSQMIYGPSPTGAALTQTSRMESETYKRQLQQYQAYQKLVEKGYAPEQLQTYTEIQKRLEPSFANILKAKAGQTIGGIAGGIAGPLILGQIPPFTFLPEELLAMPISAGICAAIGGGIGKGIQQVISPYENINWIDIFKAAGEEAAWEVGGRYTQMGLKTVFGPLIKKPLKEAAGLVDEYARVGGHFTPAQLDKRISLRMMEGISRGGFGATESWELFNKIQDEWLVQYADDVVSSIAKGASKQTPAEIGETLQKMIARPAGAKLTMFDEIIDPLYKQVDELTKGAFVSTKGLKNLAIEEIAKDKKLKQLYLSTSGRQTLNKVKQLPDNMKFGDMRELRSSFLADVRVLTKDADKAQALVKRLASRADDALFDSELVQGLTPEAERLLRNTNRLYKTGREVFDKTFTYKLAQNLLDNPEVAVKAAFPRGSANRISTFREALLQTARGTPDPDGRVLWDRLKQLWLEQTVEKSVSKGAISTTKLHTAFRQMGDDALKEMFSPDELLRIKNIEKIAGAIGRRPTGSYSLFVKGTQVGLVYNLLSGAPETGISITLKGGLALSPYAYVRLAMNPLGSKLLTAGIPMKPGSSGLASVASRMIKLLREIESKEQKEYLKMIKRKQIGEYMEKRYGHRQFGPIGAVEPKIYDVD